MLVLLRMILRQPAVPFLIDGVVVTNVGHRRDRHPNTVKTRVTKHGIQRRRPAAAPPPNAHARCVDERPFVDGPDGIGLVLRIYNALLAIDDLAPGASPRRGRAAIVDTHNDVTILRQHQVPHVCAALPFIQNCLRRRFSINIEENGVAFLRIEVRRFNRPPVQLHAIADVHPEEFPGTLFQLRQPFTQLPVVDKGAHAGVLRQADHLNHRRLAEFRIGVNGQIAGGRNNVVVGAGPVPG